MVAYHSHAVFSILNCWLFQCRIPVWFWCVCRDKFHCSWQPLSQFWVARTWPQVAYPRRCSASRLLRMQSRHQSWFHWTVQYPKWFTSCQLCILAILLPEVCEACHTWNWALCITSRLFSVFRPPLCCCQVLTGRTPIPIQSAGEGKICTKEFLWQHSSHSVLILYNRHFQEISVTSVLLQYCVLHPKECQ